MMMKHKPHLPDIFRVPTDEELIAAKARFRRPMPVQLAEMEPVIQRLLKLPEYKFLVDVVPQLDDLQRLMVGLMAEGVFDGRLDAQEFLHLYHPDKRMRRQAKKRTRAMSRGELPFHKKQLL